MAKAKAVEPVVQKQETLYTYGELIDGYKRFGVPKECAMAALRFYKDKEMSVETAKGIIDKWMRKVIV